MSRKTLILILAIISAFAILLLGLLLYKTFTKPKVIHIHAGFQVYEDNTLKDFSDIRYMNIEPCKNHEDNTNETPLHEQKEKAHLHDNIGDVVHVHRNNATWADLFKNLGYSFDTSKPIEYYVNGKQVDNLLSQKNYAISASNYFSGNAWKY